MIRIVIVWNSLSFIYFISQGYLSGEMNFSRFVLGLYGLVGRGRFYLRQVIVAGVNSAGDTAYFMYSSQI